MADAMADGQEYSDVILMTSMITMANAILSSPEGSIAHTHANRMGHGIKYVMRAPTLWIRSDARAHGPNTQSTIFSCFAWWPRARRAGGLKYNIRH